ncbi:MAG: Gfo/Idh/MocA family oxidoreductase [Clostridia bacterium]|nr:Gfo/Idh/MocA family oxidoreductase [Clostridia bacterium]MBN2882025.1 Gfo/Idh/MocA family oxidoreductase [Clostridia bacterium]
MGQYRYACIGAGGIAKWKHLPGYNELENVEVVAVSDISDTALAAMKEKYPKINIYNDYLEMLDKEKPDIVSVCTPNKYHRQMTIDAMAAGAHVHCEKPIAMNEAEAVDMINASAKYNRKLMVGLNNRFTNEAFFIRDYISNGNLGEIYHARCGWRRRRGIPGKGGWFTQKALSGGGPLIDLGVHMIDLSLYMMDSPEPLSVSAATYRKFQDCKTRNMGFSDTPSEGIFDVEDLAVGFVRLNSGASLNFEISFALNTEKEDFFYELFGTKGGVRYSNSKLEIFTEINDTLVNLYPDTNYKKKALNEFNHFIAVIEGRETNISPADDARKMMKLIGAAYRSADEGKEITF